MVCGREGAGSHGAHETLCLAPWTNAVFEQDGCVTFCCDAPALLEVDGRLADVSRDSLEQIWNSEILVETRAAMARGERPEICSSCWDREDRGVTSRRQVYNRHYARMGGELNLLELASVGANSGFRIERPPDWFIVELGNICNLRCRSCHALSSSRIAADPLHAAWNDGAVPPNAGGLRRSVSAADPTAWFRDVDRLADMIASGAQTSAVLSLMGGEPFLVKQTRPLLDGLIARGVSGHILVGVCTNGQLRPDWLAELAPAFRGFGISVSIDGYGALNEYLRNGSSWPRLVENLDFFQAIPGISVSAVPTLQNANALDMVRLVSFLQNRGIDISYNSVDAPERLRPTNLPEPVRRRAAARLREYMATEANPENAAVLRAHCERLEGAEPSFHPGLFDEFLRFTRELDASRDESLATAAPELVEMLTAAGVWDP